jgi:glucosamine-6-phosphate deaminase
MKKKFKVDKLNIFLCDNRAELGNISATTVHNWIIEFLSSKPELNMVFAAAPSQDDFLKALTVYADIPWERINAFHMDEYVGLPYDSPQRFGNYLKQRLFDLVPFKNINYLDGNQKDLEQECNRYSIILQQHPIDIVCAGIGENGHIAFNDPFLANFNDKQSVRIIKLDEKSQMQQVNDGCFANIEQVPKQALTLTIPILVSTRALACMVPGERKAAAVKSTLYGPVSEKIPASILRTHPQSILFLDADSAKLL